MTKDYVSANLDVPNLDHLFPNMIVADKGVTTWPWLRRDIDHPFRVDQRNPIVGFINRDEAAVLYGNARLFAGRKGNRDWRVAGMVDRSPCRLGSGKSCMSSSPCSPIRSGGPRSKRWRAPPAQATTTILVPEASPAAVERLGESGVRWSFAFIDGDHDGEAPSARRACACPLSRADRDGPVP